MNRKLLATMAIALFIVSTMSLLSVAPVKADTCVDVDIDVTDAFGDPLTCVVKGGTVYIEVCDNNLTESQLHNYTISVTKPTGASKFKNFSLDDNCSTFVYGTDFGTTTNVAGTYKIRVWENYWSDELSAWCQCLVGEDSFSVDAKLIVDVYVFNCSMLLEDYEYERCEEVGYVVALVQYCNGSAMDDPEATVITTLTSPTGGVAKSSPMEWVDNTDGWAVWITENIFEEECLYAFEWDDCSGDWTVGVTAVDSDGNSGYGATQVTVSPTTLDVLEFGIGYFPDCDTDNDPLPAIGYVWNPNVAAWQMDFRCEWNERIFTRCEPVFFAAWIEKACDGEPLEEGAVTVTLNTYPFNETIGWWNFSDTPTELYTIQLEYEDDEDSDWFGYWTATWNIPLDASPVGYPSTSWWWNIDDHGGTWWWANLTAADTACGDPNEGTFTTCNIADGDPDADGLLPMWVAYNTPDIIIETNEDEYSRCETIEMTVKVRYDCCNTPFKAADGGNVSATLMAECPDDVLGDVSLLETLYLTDTGTHTSDGYEIWTGSYDISVTDPADWDEEEEVGLEWTILVHAWDDAPSPRNEKTETATITVGPAEADVKVCAWIDPDAAPEGAEGKGYLYVCIKAWVCGEPVNGTVPDPEEEKLPAVVTVEITRAEDGLPIAPIYSTEYLESDPRHVWWSEDTMSWCMNFCVACIAEQHPDWLGLWNVTVTVEDPGVCFPNTGDRTVQVPAAVVKEVTWIDSECPVNPHISVWEDCEQCDDILYINQTVSIGPLMFNATVIDGDLEAKSVVIKIYDEDDELVFTVPMTNTSAIEDEDEVNYTAALPTTECLAPGVYTVKTELTYEGGFSDDVWCAIVKPGCPGCTVTCPSLPVEECGELTGCPDNNVLVQEGCQFEVVPEINLANLATLGGTFNPNGWVRFEGLVNDGCGDPLEGVWVEIDIKDPDGGTFGALDGYTDEDGKVLTVYGGILELILPQNAKLGNYTWEATLSWGGTYCYYDADGTEWEFSAEEVESSGSFLVYGRLSTMVILSSNLVYNGSSVDVIINVQDLFAGVPTSATVSGEVTKPDGTTEALTFTPIGTGIYRATYLVPSTAAAGVYTVSYLVSKPLYTGVSGSTAFSVQLRTPLPTTTIPGTTTTATTTITPADITGLLYAIAAIAAIAMIAAIVAVIIIARKTR